MALLQIDDPPNRFHDTTVEFDGPAPKAKLSVFVDSTREIISANDSPDLMFRYSVNPYRGCFHGCAYCFARPSHEFLGFGSGSDFDRKIVVKPKAAALLEKAFRRKRWTGEPVVFSGNTDCYQPLEAHYELTRSCLEVCLRYRNPVSLITKSSLIERDIDLLVALSKVTRVMINLSVPFADDPMARAIEPAVPAPTRRFETIKRLAEAGLAVGVFVSPIMPGLNDSQLVEVLERAYAAGARFATMTMVRLPGSLAQVFEQRLRAALPDRADRVLNRIREVRGGSLNDSRFGNRMRGQGPYADAIHGLFKSTTRRLGYGKRPPQLNPSTFRVPADAPGQGQAQLSLWDL